MIDARGLSCPMPVLMVQREVKKNQPKTIEVLVDNMTAVGNITRFAASQHYEVRYEEKAGDFRMTLWK
jgi:TusA-related sulfurtransferase